MIRMTEADRVEFNKLKKIRANFFVSTYFFGVFIGILVMLATLLYVGFPVQFAVCMCIIGAGFMVFLLRYLAKEAKKIKSRIEGLE